MDVVDAMDKIHDVKGVGIVELNEEIDVQRSEFVKEILKKYGDIKNGT